jgi:hypothetical protein
MGVDDDGARFFGPGVVHFRAGVAAEKVQRFHGGDEEFVILHGLIMRGHRSLGRGLCLGGFSAGGEAEKGGEGGQADQDGIHGAGLVCEDTVTKSTFECEAVKPRSGVRLRFCPHCRRIRPFCADGLHRGVASPSGKEPTKQGESDALPGG